MSYRFDHIALVVSDLEASTRFYTEVLLIPEIPNPMGGRDFRWFDMGHNQRFHMQQGDVSGIRLIRQVHFALTTDNLDGMLAHLREKGVAWTDMKGVVDAVNVRPDGMRAAFVADPDGYWIEINDNPDNR